MRGLPRTPADLHSAGESVVDVRHLFDGILCSHEDSQQRRPVIDMEWWTSFVKQRPRASIPETGTYHLGYLGGCSRRSLGAQDYLARHDKTPGPKMKQPHPKRGTQIL